MDTLMHPENPSQESQSSSATHIDTRPLGYNESFTFPTRQASPVPSETSTAASTVRGAESKFRHFDKKAHLVLKNAVEKMNEKDREISTLRQACKKLQDSIETLEWEVRSARDQQTRLTAAKQLLKTKLEEAYGENRALQDKLKDQIQKMRQLENDGVAGGRDLRDEVDRLREAAEQGRRDHEERKRMVADLRLNVDTLQVERDKLEQELTQVSAREGAVARLEEQLENGRRTNERLGAQVEELNAEIDRRRRDHSRVAADFQKQVFDGRNEIEVLEKENAQLRASANAELSKQNALEEDILELQAMLKKIEEEKMVLESRIAEAGTWARDQEKRHLTETSKYKQDLDAARAQIVLAEDRIEDLREDMAQTFAFEEPFAELERLTRCKDTGAKAIHEVNRQWELNDGLTKENLALKQQLDQERHDRRHYLEERVRTIGRIKPGASTNLYNVEGSTLHIFQPESPSEAARKGHEFFLNCIFQGESTDRDAWEEVLPLLESARDGSHVALLWHGRAGKGEDNVTMEHLLRHISRWLFDDAPRRGDLTLDPRVSCSALGDRNFWDLLAISQGLPQVLPPSRFIDFSSVRMTTRPILAVADLERAITEATNAAKALRDAGASCDRTVIRLEIQRGAIMLFSLPWRTEMATGNDWTPGALARYRTALEGQRHSRDNHAFLSPENENVAALTRILCGVLNGPNNQMVVFMEIDLANAQAAEGSVQALDFAERRQEYWDEARVEAIV